MKLALRYRMLPQRRQGDLNPSGSHKERIPGNHGRLSSILFGGRLVDFASVGEHTPRPRPFAWSL